MRKVVKVFFIALIYHCFWFLVPGLLLLIKKEAVFWATEDHYAWRDRA